MTSHRVLPLVSQGFNSLAGFALLTAAGLLVNGETFGYVGICSVAYMMVISLNQALVSEPEIVANAAGERTTLSSRTIFESSMARSVCLGAVIGAILSIALSAYANLPVSSALIFLSICLLGAVVEAARGSLIAADRRAGSALLDGALFFVQMGAVGVAAWFLPTLEGVLFGWLAGLIIAAVVAFVLLRPSVMRPNFVDWVQGRSAVLAVSLGLEALAIAGSQFVFFVLLARFVGVEASGDVRYALAVMGPVSIVLNAIRLFGLRNIARSETSIGIVRTAIKFSFQASLVSLIMGGSIAGIFSLLVQRLPNVSILIPFSILAAAAFNKFCSALCLGPTLTLRLSYRIRAGLAIRSILSILAILPAYVYLTHFDDAAICVALYSSSWILQAGLLLGVQVRYARSARVY